MDTEASLPMETSLPLHLQPSNGLYSKLPGAMEDATDKAKPLHHDTDSPPYLQPAIQAENHVRVLGIPVHKMSRPIQFIVCVAGTLILYLLYGYTQEWIFSVPDFHPLGWYFTLVQFGFYSVFGYVEMKITGEKQRVPMRAYIFLAFLTVATMGLSNASLGYLNFPTQVIFKSCKLIPVMIGGVLIQGKNYGLMDAVALAFMSVGLILFTLADSRVAPNFDVTGIVLISLALCADAIIGNVQEKTLNQYSASPVEMVTYSYAVGFVYILLGLLGTGNIISAFQICWEAYLMAAVFSMTGYLGLNFVLVLVQSFGALVAVIVTTFRKALTLMLSFLLFTKPFTSQLSSNLSYWRYAWSGLLILFGIMLNTYSKNRTQANEAIAKQLNKLLIMRQILEIRWCQEATNCLKKFISIWHNRHSIAQRIHV